MPKWPHFRKSSYKPLSPRYTMQPNTNSSFHFHCLGLRFITCHCSQVHLLCYTRKFMFFCSYFFWSSFPHTCLIENYTVALLFFFFWYLFTPQLCLLVWGLKKCTLLERAQVYTDWKLAPDVGHEKHCNQYCEKMSFASLPPNSGDKHPVLSCCAFSQHNLIDSDKLKGQLKPSGQNYPLVLAEGLSSPFLNPDNLNPGVGKDFLTS